MSADLGRLSIVVVGAHVDDTWYGMGPTMLKAVRSGHQVSVIQAVSRYESWPVVAGREAEIVRDLDRLSSQSGITIIPLGHDYLRLVNGPDLISQLSHELAKLRPDVLFYPWDDDSNPDHTEIAAAARAAAKHGNCFVPEMRYDPARPQMYQYLLDAASTSFRPDAYVDVEDSLFDLLEMNNVFNEIYDRSPAFEEGTLNGLTVIDHRAEDRSITLHSQGEYMFARSMVFGAECGRRFADAFVAYHRTPAEAELLARI